MSLSSITPIKRGEEYLQRIADAIEAGASELPNYGSGDAGKVLTVASGGASVEWDEVEALPSYAAGDSGKVLGLTGSPLAPAWVQQGGGDAQIAVVGTPDIPAGHDASAYLGNDGSLVIYGDCENFVENMAKVLVMKNECDPVLFALSRVNNGMVRYDVSQVAFDFSSLHLQCAPYTSSGPNWALTVSSTVEIAYAVLLSDAPGDMGYILPYGTTLEWIQVPGAN